MKLGEIEETILVAGETPMLEVQKTTQAINISGEFQRPLPLSSRRVWQDALDLTPGIMSRSTDQFGGSVYFLRGTENENHVVQVDGVDAGSFRQNWPGHISASARRRSPTFRSRPPASMPPRRLPKAWSSTSRRRQAPTS